MSMMTSSFRTPVFGDPTLITLTGLSTLADATTLISSAIDNSATRFAQLLINLNLGGTAAATAWLDVRMLVSTDRGVTYQSWENGFVLPPFVLSVTPNVYQARVMSAEYWKLAIRNNTGAVLTAGTAYYQGIRI